MAKFALTLKNGEVVHIISASNLDEAIDKFCFGKKLTKSVLFSLYDVKKI